MSEEVEEFRVWLVAPEGENASVIARTALELKSAVIAASCFPEANVDSEDEYPRVIIETTYMTQEELDDVEEFKGW